MNQLQVKRKSHIELNKIYFWTATINFWQKLLELDAFKEIIIESLNFLYLKGKLKIYAFVIMPNHIHFVIECLEMNGKEMPHVSFLKYTAHEFKKMILKQDPEELNNYRVEQNNKKYEFWQKNSYAFELFQPNMAKQKIDYIHNNPMQKHWQLCNNPEDYKYSSANFYKNQDNSFMFLKNIDNVM